MTQFTDLSPYNYLRSSPAEKNVGWIGPTSQFEAMNADESFLDRLWCYCKISVAPTRGIHDCELCDSRRTRIAERHGETLLLGSAEIRVFSSAGDVYAAPNLIYHYVQAHGYRPPDEFIQAVQNGLLPDSSAYLERLSELGWPWERTESPSIGADRRFRAVKTPEGIKIVED